jgi:BirA family biotin operon repressor/biotin-[acetyl-CoA-carboxylase] ligase
VKLSRVSTIEKLLPNSDAIVRNELIASVEALISLVIGASLCKVIHKYIKCDIKWPNDIIINNKKVAGILVEGIVSNEIEAVVVGVGININSTSFPNDLIIKATSLKNELGKDISKEEILNEILSEFDSLYIDFLNGNNTFINIIKKNNYLKNKEVYINNKKIKVLDINELGNLVILEDNIEKEIYYGEVTLTNIYNN